jgi:hypothetical protein
VRPTHPNQLHSILSAGQAAAVDKLKQLNASLSDPAAALVTGVSGVSKALQDPTGELLQRLNRSAHGIENVATATGGIQNATAAAVDKLTQLNASLSDPGAALVAGVSGVSDALQDPKGEFLQRLDRSAHGIENVAIVLGSIQTAVTDHAGAFLAVLHRITDTLKCIHEDLPHSGTGYDGVQGYKGQFERLLGRIEDIVLGEVDDGSLPRKEIAERLAGLRGAAEWRTVMMMLETDSEGAAAPLAGELSELLMELTQGALKGPDPQKTAALMLIRIKRRVPPYCAACAASHSTS